MSPIWFILALVIGIVMLAAGIIIGVVENNYSTWYFWLLVGLGALFILLGIILAILYFVHREHHNPQPVMMPTKQNPVIVHHGNVYPVQQPMPAQQPMNTTMNLPVSTPPIPAEVTYTQSGSYIFTPNNSAPVVNQPLAINDQAGVIAKSPR